MSDQQWAAPVGIGHVRLTVTDIVRSKDFYRRLFGTDPAVDFSGELADAAIRDDPNRLYGGCVFRLGDQLFGLRPVALRDDRFDSSRVGLDHVSLQVPTKADLDDAADRLEAAGVEHGDVRILSEQSMAILSLQDPDDINIELTASV